MKERCFLRVHFPCVQHLECDSAQFHDMWNELIFGFRKNYVFTHTVTDKAYQPMENDLFMYVEQEKYVVWDDGVPYEYGFIQREDETLICEDDLNPEIEIV